MRAAGETGAGTDTSITVLIKRDLRQARTLTCSSKWERGRQNTFDLKTNFHISMFCRNFINGKSNKVKVWANFGNSKPNLETFPDFWYLDPGLRALSRGRHREPRAPRRRTRWASGSTRTRSSETVVKCIIQWLTQVRENLGICLTIFGIVMVAVIVTTIKIFLFDKETYPSLFYTPEELEAMKNKTVNNSSRCIYSCTALETTDDVWHFNFTISEPRSQQHYFWNMKKSWTSTFNQRDKTKLQQKIFM